MQPLLHVNGLHWGAAALHEDEDTAAKKEKIVKAFAVDPIAYLSGKVTRCEIFSFHFLSSYAQVLTIENGSVESLKFQPTRAKELCFTIQLQ